MLSALALLYFPSGTYASFKPTTFEDESTPRPKFTIKAVRIHGDIQLTGRLTDPKWSLAPQAGIDYQVQPVDNVPASQKTTVLVLYNSRYLYLGFICHDTDPSKIRAHVSDRDNMFNDDFVGVFLDTYNNHQRAYEFFVNPFGIQGDGMRTGNNEDITFDAVWYSAAALNDSGYTVEMAVPFKSLHFPALKDEDWGVELLRNLPRDSRYQFTWTHIDLNDPCVLCQGGILEGLEGLQSTGSLEVLPYAMGLESGSINDDSDPTSGFANGPVKGRIGGGVRYSPNPSLSAEGVVNPDFSQVESDAAQISVNTTFALFYPEKRPFFIDASDLFNTTIQAFYSRQINNPLGAVKLTEKSGSLSLAYIGGEDRNSPFIIAGEEESNAISSSYWSYSNALRAKYDFGTQSYVGAIGTARNFANAHNYVGGLDWSLFFGGNYTFDGQFLYSDTKELNDTSLFSDNSHYGNTKYTKAFDGQEYGGTGLVTEIRRDAKLYSFRLTYRDFSPTFQAQDGFVFSNNLRTADMEHTLQFYPNSSILDRWGLDLESGLHFNYGDSRKERWILPTAYFNFKGQSQLNITYFLVNDELFRNVNFVRVNRWSTNFNANPWSFMTFNLSAAIGRFIYRADTTALGRGHNINAELTLKPTGKFILDISYARSRLSNVVGGELLFDGYISRLTGTYQFNNQIFVRLIGQYDQFNKAIEIDPLFSYKLNPFTIFYAGSTHSMTNFGDPYGVVQTGRQFFVKLQYLWRD